MPSRPNKLREAFALYNSLYFASKLSPDTIVVWSSRLKRDVAGEFDGDTTVRINSRLRHLRPCWKLTLLHEMAHVATASEVEEHGPRWNREMRRLYRVGAFDTLL
jgi:hypothetical protein